MAFPWGTLVLCRSHHSISQGCPGLVLFTQSISLGYPGVALFTHGISLGYPGLTLFTHSIPHGLVLHRDTAGYVLFKEGPLRGTLSVGCLSEVTWTRGPCSPIRTASARSPPGAVHTNSLSEFQCHSPRVVCFCVSLKGTHSLTAICNTTSLRGSPGPGRDVMQPDQSDWRPARMESPSVLQLVPHLWHHRLQRK